MRVIVTLADIGFLASVIVVIFIILAVIALVVSLWLYRWSRGPRLTRCPYCRKVIQWGITVVGSGSPRHSCGGGMSLPFGA